MDIMEWFLIVIFLVIFALLCWGAVYIVILFINSKGFSISPTVTSDGKSVKIMANYIKEYNENNLKKIDLKILDIGSGYGKLLFKMNKILQDTNNVFVGYEISKFSYKISKFLNKSKNVYIINDDVNNIMDTDFDFIISFMLERQQKHLINLYKKFRVGAIILANSNPIPFEKDDGFELIDKVKVHLGWSVFVYKKIF